MSEIQMNYVVELVLSQIMKKTRSDPVDRIFLHVKQSDGKELRLVLQSCTNDTIKVINHGN